MADNIKKIQQKIEKEQSKLDNILSKKKTLIAEQKKRIAEIDKEISAQRSIIASLQEDERKERIAVFAQLAEKKGISVDDLFAAMASGNFNIIQEKADKAGK